MNWSQSLPNAPILYNGSGKKKTPGLVIGLPEILILFGMLLKLPCETYVIELIEWLGNYDNVSGLFVVLPSTSDTARLLPTSLTSVAEN